MASRNGLMPIIPVNGIMDGNNPRGIPTTLNSVVGFVFGNSLFSHNQPPTASVQTTAGYWLGDIAAHSGTVSAFQGQFGQLRDQTLPPNQEALIGYPTSTFQPWPEPPPLIPFSDVGFDTTITMPSNFEYTTVTPSEFVDQSAPVLDFIQGAEPTARIYIYEHWPEPPQVGTSVFNINEMTSSDFLIYNTQTTQGGTIHTWFLGYQNEMVNRGYPVQMIPTGPIIADMLLTEPYMSTVGYSDLYFDDAPHGNPTCYLLAALICYRAMYMQNPASGYVPTAATPVIIPEVLNNIPAIISFIDQRLAFYNSNGVRVFL